jgi:hypothetical protein
VDFKCFWKSLTNLYKLAYFEKGKLIQGVEIKAIHMYNTLICRRQPQGPPAFLLFSVSFGDMAGFLRALSPPDNLKGR